MAPPPGSRAAGEVLRPGDLLAARYRLVRPVPSPGSADRPAVLWLATDEVLARPVAAKVLPVSGPDAAAATSAFLDAASAGGSATSPVLVRVYDAAVEQRPADAPGEPGATVAYVISEWVDGTPLAEVLERDGPFAPAAAVALTTTVAEALTAVHAQGLAHGRVHPGNLLLTAGGRVRLTDLGASAALPDGTVAADRDDDPDAAGADVRDLAAVLYALLTARWPASATPQPSGGVPAAPAAREGSDQRGRLVRPGQVRAGVPRALDALVVRALDPRTAGDPPPLTTAAGLSDALERAVGPQPGTRTSRRRRSAVPTGLRRVLPVVVLLLLLGALGAGAWSVGRTIGTVRTPADELEAAAPRPSGSASAAPAVPIDLAGVAVRDFDPEGDGTERPGSVANATDGDPTTTWVTERYDTASFAGLKQGVGLLVDLGAPTAVTRAEVVLAEPGVSAELRSAAEPGEDAAAYRVLATGEADGDRLVLTPPAGTRDRYYLLWFTGLAPDDERFSAGVSELLLTGTGG